ncbi:serine hydrolase domain-containing protein [Methyloversatilis thermotolerans]|uniref:serine hydrolase domain-containing protein n=1 Tax=Methyloversatilis thermotolerans TaxID=1346290 RepID=UPI0003719E4E|nr:serine hydrolase domain-containing protein [Methyloversatilis thermotolerans]
MLCKAVYAALGLAASLHSSWASDQCDEHFRIDVVQSLRAAALPAAQVALKLPGEHPFTFAIGDASPGRPLGVDDALPLASLSKIVTGLAVLDAVADGRWTLDSRLIDILGVNSPHVGAGVERIRIGDLLGHRAGFLRLPGPDEMLRPHPRCPGRSQQLLAIPLARPPGSGFDYSNTGYCLLGEALSHNASAPVIDVLAATVSRRLGEHSSFARWQPSGALRLHASPDDAGDNPRLFRFNIDALLAAGGLQATAADMARLLDTGFPPEMLGSLDTSAPDCPRGLGPRRCHGLIFHVLLDPTRGRRLFWRDGSLPGVTAVAVKRDDGKWSAVLLATQRRQDWRQFNELWLATLSAAAEAHAQCRASVRSRPE